MNKSPRALMETPTAAPKITTLPTTPFWCYVCFWEATQLTLTGCHKCKCWKEHFGQYALPFWRTALVYFSPSGTCVGSSGKILLVFDFNNSPHILKSTSAEGRFVHFRSHPAVPRSGLSTSALILLLERLAEIRCLGVWKAELEILC